MKKNKKKIAVLLLIDSECYLRADPQFLGLTKKSKSSFEYAIANALRNNGYLVSIAPIGKNFHEVVKVLQDNRPDLVFNYVHQVHGSRNAEVNIPALLDLLHYRYTGPGTVGLMMSIDKKLCKDVLRQNGILTPSCFEITSKKDERELQCEFPAIVKPNFDGGSTGITGQSIVKNKTQLTAAIKKLRSAGFTSVIVESFIAGREATVALVGNGKHLHAYPAREIKFLNDKNGWSILTEQIKSSYRLRRRSVQSEKLKVSKDALQQIEKIARTVFRLLKMRDYARIDFRINSQGQIFVVDTNCNPGLNPRSWVNAFNGKKFETVIKDIVECALKRSK